MNRRSLLACLLLALAGLLSRPVTAEDPALVVFAAASLTESLTKVGAAWTARGNPNVRFSFDATSRIARQVEAGAPVDVFFSADSEWMGHLHGKGLIEPSTRVDLLGNALVAIVPADSTIRITSAADLARPEIRRLALAGESVPAGRYARTALRSLGTWDLVKARVVSGDNVRSVLGWVAAGEAEAGAVYATDARVEPRVKVAFRFPEQSYPPIVYPAAIVKGAAHAETAREFLAFCQSAEGMALFMAAGFTPPPPRTK